MAHSQKYYYNEHDENQVEKILKIKKKKKLKRRVKVILFLIFAVSLMAYFLSDYSKVQSIKVIGNEEVSTETILEYAAISDDTIYWFLQTQKVEEHIKEVPLIKKVNVSKDLLGNVRIEVEEAERIAYCVIDDVTYVIDELGGVSETEDEEVIQSLQSCPRLLEFEDVEFLKEFAAEYVQIPELIKSQTSDIIYAPKEADETRLEFIMNNGKILYLRLEDMVDQLSRFDYEAFMTAYSDSCVFSFEGKYVYKEKCE